MARKVEGATGTRAYKFAPEEIENLKVSPQLVRWEELDLAHVKSLAQSIAEHGQTTPVLIRVDSEGVPELVAGRHRRAAILHINNNLKEYGIPKPLSLVAIKKNLTDEQALMASFEENTGRPPTVMDLATAAGRFENLEYTNKEIAEILTTPHQKVSNVRVGQLLQFLTLPEPVQALLHRGEIKESGARALIELGYKGTRLERTAEQLESGELTGSDLAQRVRAKKREEGKTIKRGIRDLLELLQDLGTGPADTLHQWLDGKIDDEEVKDIFKDREIEIRPEQTGTTPEPEDAKVVKPKKKRKKKNSTKETPKTAKNPSEDG